MKKLLVVLFAAMLVLGLSAASMAAINWNGEIKTGYDWMEKAGADKLTLKIDAKVSDTVSAYAKLEGKGSDVVKVDEANFTVKTTAGAFTFGDVDYNITGVNGEGELELLADDTTLETDELEDNFEIIWNAAGLPEGLILKVGYVRDNADYWVTFGYCTEKWGIDYNYLNFGDFEADVDDDDVLEAVEGFNAWTANAFFKPIENLTVYAHFADAEDADNETAIIGVYGEFGKFFAYYEYNTQDRNDENAYGYEIGYNFNNKVQAYYEYASIEGDDATQDLMLKVKFK